MKTRIARMCAIAACALSAAAPAALQGETDAVAEAKFAGNAIRVFARPLGYEVSRNGKILVPRTAIDVRLDGADIARDAAPAGRPRCVPMRGGDLPTPFYKKSSISLAGMEACAEFADFAVRLVARADGVAYRFELKKPGTVADERADVKIPKTARCQFNRTARTSLGCEETVPEFADASLLPRDGKKAFYLPFVFSADGVTVAVTEADVHDYPILNFGDVEESADGVVLKSLFARYPKKTAHISNVDGWEKRKVVPSGGRWIKVVERENFIAKAAGARTLPWRVFVLADSPAKLCEADIVYALAEPAEKGADFSWVRPGKVAWDWWNAFDNKGDPAGCTTATYERFIDFAAANGVEYVIFDEGWSAALNIWKYSPAVDVPHLIEYANKKGVGIILWMAWAQICGDEERVAGHFAKLGAKGFKVDFMDRADAEVAVFLEKFAAACVKHHMLVDYHGVYRPVGLQRKYPNILNFEGIHGLENMKWGKKDKDMCMNDVACFYLRMTAGPMDYTPGAMDNYPLGEYAGNGRNPGSVGTRSHQMALFTMYEAPLQMLCDSPTKYEKNMESFAFMAKTPVVWADVVGLGGSPETFAAVARRAKDGSWHVAGINNREARDFVFDTSFLGEGEWMLEMFRDVGDAKEDVMRYVHETKRVAAGEKMSLHMAPGGGFTARFGKRP